MSKHDPIYTTVTFRRKGEEVPLLISGGTRKPLWFCGTIEVEFEVSVEPADPTQWWISDVWMVCDNGKTGKEAAGNVINLDADADRHFYLMVLDSIDHKYGRSVPEWIADELALLDIRPSYDRVA